MTPLEGVHMLWSMRQCWLCGALGPCPHRELEVDEAIIGAATQREEREHAPAPERPPAGVRRKPARTLRVVGSSGKASNHD